MIKTILSIIKYTIIISFASIALYSLLWISGILDWSLFAWAKDIFPTITWDFRAIFNYPNAWILFSYIIGRDMLLWGVELLIGKAKKGAKSNG